MNFSLSVFRGFLGRRRYHRLKIVFNTAALTIQSNYKGWTTRRWYRQELRTRTLAVMTIQAIVKGWLARTRYATKRRSVTRIQASFRGWSVRNTLKREKVAKEPIYATLGKFLVTSKLLILDKSTFRNSASNSGKCSCGNARESHYWEMDYHQETVYHNHL